MIGAKIEVRITIIITYILTNNTMATTKKVSDSASVEVSNSSTVQLDNMRKAYQNMVDSGLMPQETADKLIAASETALKSPARDKVNEQVIAAVQSALKAPAILDAFKIMGDGAFTVTVVIKEGQVHLVKSRTQTTKQGSALQGKRGTIFCDGVQYASYAELCRAKGLDVGGDNARRVYLRASGKDSKMYPPADEVEQVG